MAQTGTAFTDLERERWNGLIEPFCGTYFAPSRTRQLESALRASMMAEGLDDLGDYYRYIAAQTRGSAPWRALIAQIVNGQTSFFRQPDVLEAIATSILPELIAAKRQSRAMDLKLCSVGCSTGEEAYTLAMIAADQAGAWAGEIRVAGVDVSEAALARARDGRFDERRASEVPPDYRRRYLRPLSDGRNRAYAPAPRLRAMTEFRPFNLAQPDPLALGAQDLIVCQNVLIYFRAEPRQRALAVLASCLRPGGYLMLGPGEVAAAPQGLRQRSAGGLTLFQAPPRAGRA